MSDATVTDEQLRLLIERIERLQEERKGFTDDIRDVFTEAKSQGYDAKAMRAILKIRKQARADRLEQEAIVELYKSALGIE